MRYPYSLSSSSPSHLNGQDDISYQSHLELLQFSHSSRESSLSEDSIPELQHLDSWPLEIRNCMLDSEGEQWLQPHGYNLTGPLVSSSDNDFVSTAAPEDFSQLYGDSVYQPAFQPGFTQQSGGPHRRLPSSSSVTSAVESPFSRTPSVSVQQYPSTYTQPNGFSTPHQVSGWAWDSFSPASSAQHLPTPSGTPTPEQLTQALYAQNARQTKHLTPDQQALRVRAHNSLVLSLNQQYKPGTYTQSHMQTQNAFVEMPRTPQTVHGDDGDGQQFGTVAATVPKLGRTVSDARADELYNPWSSTPTYGDPSTVAPRPQGQNFLQPQPPVLQERLIAAHKARSSSPSSPSGHASPFRQFPYGNASDCNIQGVSQAPTAMPNYAPIGPHPGLASQQDHKRVEQDNEEPKTVSPKEAFPEQPMSKADENYSSLFPDSNPPLQYAPHNAHGQDLNSLTSMAPSSFSYPAMSMPVSTHFDVKQESASQEPQYGPVYASVTNSGNANYLPPNLTSMETTKSEESDQSESAQDSGAERPSDTSAGSGAYSCTFKHPNGVPCYEKFENAMELTRHRKEHTRQAGNSKGDPSASKMSQAGPHFCQRLKPNGEKCGEKFTRPYDLTRHEETLHGNRKKVRCPHCAEEKLFSRGDALTRHLRVVHSNLPQAASKQRRRRSGA